MKNNFQQFKSHFVTLLLLSSWPNTAIIRPTHVIGAISKTKVMLAEVIFPIRYGVRGFVAIFFYSRLLFHSKAKTFETTVHALLENR